MSSPKITQSLHLKAQQQLVMTPQLQQAIKLLQMTNLELDAFIEAQIENNPLLEKIDAERTDVSVEEMAEDEKNESPAEDEFSNDWTEQADDTVCTVPSGSDFDAGVARTGSGGNPSFDDQDMSFENRIVSTKTLRTHLIEQLQQSCENEIDRRIGLLLIDLLDETGYLRIDPVDLATRLGIPIDRLNSILGVLRGFDPTGIFARDLKDCLSLQLLDRGRLDPPFQKLLEHLDLVALHDHRKLASLCGVNETYLRDMLTELKTLSPKPAGAFDHLVVQTALPDVLMKALPKNLGGGWRVELNPATLPRVLVNETYYQDVLSHAKTEKDKTYLSDQMSNAHWLTRALDQRAQTILKVAAEIIERQNAFFLYGIEFLQPMILKDIAEGINMHESTVSRVTTGKFIGTPRGIFEMKFFFTTSISGVDGQNHSAESVKARIKTLIDGETLDSVLSDDALSDLLTKEGIDIARRTIAKYREGMNIPSSSARRRIMKNRGPDPIRA